MVRLQAGGLAVNDIELRINLSALLIGGNLTTTDLIGNAVRLLLLNPAELAKLRADPGIINSVVEEALRYEPPVDITGRVASHDMEVAGCPVKPKQSLTFFLRSANPRPRGVRRSGPFRCQPPAQAARLVRRRGAHLHRRAAGPARGAGRPGAAVRALPRTCGSQIPTRRLCGAPCRSFRGLERLELAAD